MVGAHLFGLVPASLHSGPEIFRNRRIVDAPAVVSRTHTGPVGPPRILGGNAWMEPAEAIGESGLEIPSEPFAFHRTESDAILVAHRVGDVDGLMADVVVAQKGDIQALAHPRGVLVADAAPKLELISEGLF